MLDRLVEQRDAVTLVLAAITSVKNLSAQQWATAADLTSTLRPFLDVTTIMSSASYPTLSMVIPVLDGLKHLLVNATGGLDVLRDVLLRLIDEKFGDVKNDDDLCVATVVDPRFKLLPLDDDAQRQRAVTATLSAMVSQAPAADPSPTPSTSVAQTSNTPAAATSMSIWGKLSVASASAGQPARVVGRSQESLKHELEMYTSDQPIPREDCPLRWWSGNSGQFPVVAQVARRLLSIPATSVASERLFSKAGDIITKKRNSLAPHKADMLVFLMDNVNV